MALNSSGSGMDDPTSKRLMCLSCGYFVATVSTDSLRPQSDRCPECRGTLFRDPHVGTIVRTDPE